MLRTIVVIDDMPSQYKLEVLQNICPGDTISTFTTFEDYLAVLSQEPHPDILVLDPTRGDGRGSAYGAEGAQAILQNLEPGLPWPAIVFISAEKGCAEEAEHILRDKLEVDGALSQIEGRTLAVPSDIWTAVEKLVTGDDNGRELVKWKKQKSEIRAAINAIFALSLPLTETEFDAYLFYQTDGGLKSDFNVWDLSGKSREKQIAGYAQTTLDMIADDCHVVVENGCADAYFDVGRGDPVAGPALFDPAQAEAFAQAHGVKPVCLVETLRRDAAARLLPLVSGLVVFDGKDQAHLEAMADAFNVPILLSLSKPDNEFDGAFKVSFSGQDTANGFVRLDVEEETSPRAVVRTGGWVTMDPFRGRLCLERREITEPRNKTAHGKIAAFGRLLEEWASEKGVPKLNFMATIDSLGTPLVLPCDGIGLVRSESLLAEMPKAGAVIRAALLGDATALARVEAETTRHIESLWDWPVLRGNQAARIQYRLFDAPLAEFLEPREVRAFEERFGEKRGVQLARCDERFYLAQLRGLMKAQASESWWSLRVLVPSAEGGDDMDFLENLIHEAARQTPKNPNDLESGFMMETLHAGTHIRDLASRAEFMNIGGNDFTAQVMKCRRDDYARRAELVAASKRKADPFHEVSDEVLAALTPIVTAAREVNPELEIVFCGAQASSLSSLERLRPLALDGVSVPPTTKNLLGLPVRYGVNSFNRYRQARRKGASLSAR